MEDYRLDNNTDSKSKALKEIYKESSKFILLGLTGRTGSGCSTAAKILSEETIRLPKSSNIYSSENDKRKYRIVRNYIKENWKPFSIIQMRVVITGILLELEFENFKDLIADALAGRSGEIGKKSGVTRKEKSRIFEKLKSFEEEYNKAHFKIYSYKHMLESNDNEKTSKKDEAWEVYFKFLPDFCKKLKEILQNKLGANSYTLLYQYIGDNIRASGTANSSEFEPDKIFTLPKIVNKLIKVIRDKKGKENETFIVIDAIRNPFEAYYFHQRYAGFYLVSVNTPNEERLDHLRKNHKFSEEQIKKLDKKEYPENISGERIYTSQNIQKCIEISDIHLNNPNQKFDHNELRSQLLWYISLILHPGLVTPTSMERCMQLAYTAKLNSGCISRQVGAIVTDQFHSIKSIGWNDTPEGQTPCLLRSTNELLNGSGGNVYSTYERTDETFRNYMEHTFKEPISSDNLKGRMVSYCFKEIRNEIDKEKNQVHTRSLHAEENAFLQIAKYGGEAIRGGFLFTTASPCELCSKKAYQLGIKRVIFVDPYPGISKEHVLSSGANMPELVLYSGAIGRAYHRLYQPLIPYKDELKMLTNYSIKSNEELKKYQ